VHTGFWWGDLRERDRRVGTSILKWTLQKWDGRHGLDWSISRRIGGGQLWHGNEPFGFLKMRGISWLAADQLASQDRLCSTELVHVEYKAPLFLQCYRSAMLSLWQKTYRRATCTAKDALVTCITKTSTYWVLRFRDEIHQPRPLLSIEFYSNDDGVGRTAKHCCRSGLIYRKNNSGIPNELGEAMETISRASATPDTWTDHLSDTRQGRYSFSQLVRWCLPNIRVLLVLHRQLTISDWKNIQKAVYIVTR